MNVILKTARRVVLFIAGFLVILLGIILIPLPGPGVLIVLAGLAILAIEFEWAKKHHRRVKRLSVKALEKALDKMKS